MGDTYGLNQYDIATSLAVVTPNVAEPVTLAEAKLHCRIDESADDALVTELIKAAREYIERVTSRAMMETEYDFFLDQFPSVIYLPRCPAISVTSLKYVDEEGVEQTLSNTLYRVDTSHEPPRITPAYGEVWPTTQNVSRRVTVRFKAGYANAAAVPSALKVAVKLLMGHWYENRETVVVGETSKALENTLETLLWAYRTWYFV